MFSNYSCDPKYVPRKAVIVENYDRVVVVAGTRYWENIDFFHKAITSFVNKNPENILFVSGKASSGPDHLIIEWCKQYGYPYILMPANWEQYRGNVKNPAGFIRNEDMAKICTDVITFWDGLSSGTENMIINAIKYRRNLINYKIHLTPEAHLRLYKRPIDKERDLYLKKTSEQDLLPIVSKFANQENSGEFKRI